MEFTCEQLNNSLAFNSFMVDVLKVTFLLTNRHASKTGSNYCIETESVVNLIRKINYFPGTLFF